MRRLGILLTAAILAGCDASSGGAGAGLPDLPAGSGPLATGAVTWATGARIHVGNRTVRVGRPVRAMVGASGRVYFTRGVSDALWVTDGEQTRRTGYETDELRASADGRYLGFFDRSRGTPWSTVVVNLESGGAVVDDDAGMGDPEDDLTDLYEDAAPQVLGFDGDDFYARTASGNRVLSWDVRSGERTDHGDQLFFPAPDPGGGRTLPALVRHGRLVVVDDPYLSTQWGHASPDGSVTLQPVGDETRVFDVGSGRELPADLTARSFLLGGWTGPGTAYGIAFDRSPYGPEPVRLVRCVLTLEEQRCRTLRTVRPPEHRLVVFPTGSPVVDY